MNELETIATVQPPPALIAISIPDRIRLLLVLRSARRALIAAAKHLVINGEADQLCADALDRVWDLITALEGGTK